MVKRYGSVIAVKPDKLDDYKYHHANAWEKVNDMIKACKIQNYSIYYHDGLLFSYFEYTGDDYDADMKKMADDETTRKWWDLVKPFQTPLDSRKEGEWWADMEEVYHLD